MERKDVSIVIVCMNNYKQLKKCLDSIKSFTFKVSYETLVVAYFFSKDNLHLLQVEYPWVTIIESNEIRGFSANNNLALRAASGKYYFVVNDDTYFDMPVIDLLYSTINDIHDAALVSPKILNPQGGIQYSGIPPIKWYNYLLILYKLKKERVDKTGKYIRTEGIFKTYNILGAAFLIKSDVFRKMGFFDERYFYGPEDKALSTLLNKNGYYCYVNADIDIFHLGGASGGPKSKTVCATRPAERKGSVIFYAEGNKFIELILKCCIWLNSALWSIAWRGKYLLGYEYSEYSLQANINVCKTIFSKKTTTEIFKQFYSN